MRPAAYKKEKEVEITNRKVGDADEVQSLVQGEDFDIESDSPDAYEVDTREEHDIRLVRRDI
jgi:hypothetical protein